MRWLIDTNIVIAISKQRSEVLQRLQHTPASDILLSSVVLAEIEYGIVKSARPEHNRRVYDAIVQAFAVVNFTAEAARHYGRLRAELERQGQPIGPNDMMIAAQALATQAVLVTDNQREFSRVTGLTVENWLA